MSTETTQQPKVTVIFPCLNEEESIATVIAEAREALEAASLDGEILVSDNGSTDRSVEIALAEGVRVISASPKGYGSAYLCGIASAKGEILVMADADMTYPLNRIGDFVKACETSEMAIGIRETKADNMPTLNRLVGNPVLSGLARFLFSATVKDFHCGMRAIRRDVAERLGMKTTGMEFASEMVILALQSGLTIEEIPIEYRERVGESKLNRWEDGWRHVKFLLAHSPNRLFLYPGWISALIGLAGTLAFIGGPISLGGRPWFVHAQFVFVAIWLVGLQLLSLGWLTRSLERVSTQEPKGFVTKMINLSMERTLVIGALLTFAGVVMVIATTAIWGFSGAGELRGSNALVAGMALLIGGLQLIAVSWCRAMVDVTVLTEELSFSDITAAPVAAHEPA
jgi:glycosyltransferase involved in cell wall biosynthesis